MGGGREFSSIKELLNPAARADSAVKEALNVFATAFWYFAGNVVLAYGAWDGLILTGSIAAQTRAILQQSEFRRHFMISGPYSRRLAEVPVATASYRYAELEGAAAALLVDDTHKAFKEPASPASQEQGFPAVDATLAARSRTEGWAPNPLPSGSTWHRSRRPACA
jgi:hypothetical protein